MSPQEITSLVFNILITIGKAVGAIPGVSSSHHYAAIMKSLHESHEAHKPKDAKTETESASGGPTPSSSTPPGDVL